MFRLEWNSDFREFNSFMEVQQFISQHSVTNWVLFEWVYRIGWVSA